jgi:S1-C subfamily serine protease
MNRSLLFCIFSALVGGLAATAWHQTASLREAQAQQPGPPSSRRGSAFQPPLPGRPDPVLGFSGNPNSGTGDLPANSLAGLDDFTPEERTNILVYEKANRSVVHITTKATQRELIFDVPAEGTGSGSVLDKSGHILTNYHVVEGATEVRVTLANGESFDASLVGYDPPNDVAVLKIEAPADMLNPIQLGDSSHLRVGQLVYAIGNPFGLERTMTTGIISSLNRTLPTRVQGRTMKSIIQIDAALNRGNSGGPLIDSHGRLIGMNTAIASSTGENTGVGFAIPVDTIKRVAAQLIANGKVIRPETGISRVFQSEQGLVIATLIPGGPAEQAGLRGFKIVRETKRRGPFTYEERRIDRSQADTIVAVDGERVTTADSFLTLIEQHRPGERPVLTVLRDGQLAEIQVTLASAE